MNPKFNLESNFIKHADKNHEESLDKIDKTGFDYGYQAEFKEFFLNILDKVGIDIAPDLYNTFDSRIFYTNHFFRDFVLQKNPSKRLDLDWELGEDFHKYRNSNLDLNQAITNAYLDKVNFSKLNSIIENETDQAKKNFLILIIQIINPDAISKTKDEVKVKIANPAERVGACVEAEEHMMAFVSGKHTNPENGYINLILDDNSKPLMLEKIDLGDSHSCVSLKPIRIGKIFIPAGAIFAARPSDHQTIKTRMQWFPKKEGAINYVTTLNDYEGFKFLRMSLLSLPEEIRGKAGGSNYLHQQSSEMGYINYDWITPEIIAEYAEYRLKQEGK